MIDDTYVLKFTGEDKDLVEKIEHVTDLINKNQALTLKFNKERTALARQDRKNAFNALSIEEKKARLAQKQLDIERHLERARSSGNNTRQNALQKSLARTKSSMGIVMAIESASMAEKRRAAEIDNAIQRRAIEAEAERRRRAEGMISSKNRRKEVVASSSKPVMSKDSSGFAGGAMFAAASRFLGPAAIFGALTGAARSALRFADETSDLADQMGITREQVVQITRAAGAAGVNVRHVMGGLSSLSAVRSAALGGDVKAQELFRRYKVNPNEDNILSLAQGISGSLGPAGMGSKDRGAMGQLLGRRPEAILAALRSIQDIGNIEEELRKVDEANAKLEQFYNKVKETNVKIAASLLDYANSTLLGTVFSKLYKTKFEPGNPLPTSFADKRRMEDTILTPSPTKSPAQIPQIMGSIPQADSLARMGLYIGGGPNSTAGIMKQQLTELKAIKASSQQTVQNISKI